MLALSVSLLSHSGVLWAQGSSPPPALPAEPVGDNVPDRTSIPEEDDFSSTPFTEYGEFNEEADEEADTKFLQFGRLFGVSIAIGLEAVDGNRGLLWQGGFPLVDFKLHYWFDFNFALDVGFYTANHYFDTSAQNGGHVDANMFHLGVDIKYYFDTKNLSAPLSFANPYLLIGTGAYTKTQTSTTLGGTPDNDTSLGLKAGAGLEFVLKPKKIYFELEGKVHLVTFKDTYSTAFQNEGKPNLTGLFYTVSAGILFTW